MSFLTSFFKNRFTILYVKSVARFLCQLIKFFPFCHLLRALFLWKIVCDAKELGSLLQWVTINTLLFQAPQILQ